MQNMNGAALQPTAPIPVRLVNWWNWYQQLTGLDTVEVSKQNVIRIQDKVFQSQEQRQQLSHQAMMVSERLKEIYGELLQTKRNDPKYVQLTIMENKELQEQGRITNNIKLLETVERDNFTQLATAIKEYHDSQAINAQKYKYLSVVMSALLAFVSLTGSMIYNNKRISEIRNVISESQIQNELNNSQHFKGLENFLNEKFQLISQLSKASNSASAVESELLNMPVVNVNSGYNDDIDEIKRAALYVGSVALCLYILGRFVSG